MRLPAGFRATGFSAGLKVSGRPDLGAIIAQTPGTWAYTGTLNVVKAPCVERNRELEASLGPAQAVVVNSGHANCATGAQGSEDNDRYASLTAEALGIDPSQILTASTGVVGKRLPMETLESGIRRLQTSLTAEVNDFARAILTTDTTTKLAAIDLPGGGRVVGVAKGSGMIHPNMATMLAFVLTDVEIEQSELRSLWRGVVDRSFNQVTVDGDTSPNDMAIVLSSGLHKEDRDEFASGLWAVTRRLGRMIARDGEGATRLLTVRIDGARSSIEARSAARTVAGSPLVKAAVHGNDPNWGRILVALGRSGAIFDPRRAVISMQNTVVYAGSPVDFDESQLAERLTTQEVLIHVDLAAGTSRGEAWGCDLSAEYVRINADYTT